MGTSITVIDIDDPNDGGGGGAPGAQYGNVIGLFPSDSRFKIEIRRAEDLAGSPNVGTITILDSDIRPTERTYVDFLSPGSGPFHYATRHVPGGVWSCWRGPVSPSALTGAELVNPVMPKPRESTVVTATLGTLNLTVDDIQCRLTQVRMKSKSGAAAETAYAVVTIAGGVYTGSVTLANGLQSTITYELTFYNEVGALAILERVVTFSAANVPAILSVTVTFDSGGAPTLTIRGNALTASIKYAVSTSGQPTATTVRGTTGIAGQELVVSPAIVVAIGTTLYVSAFAYGSTGEESSPLTALAFVRPTTDDTTTLTAAVAAILDASVTTTLDERSTFPNSLRWIDGVNTTVTLDLVAGTIQIDTTGGGGGGGGTRTVTTLTTGTIAANGQLTGSLVLAKGTVLWSARVVTGTQARFRAYGTTTARDADLARAVDVQAVAGSYPAGTGISVDLLLASDTLYYLACDPKPVLGDPSSTPATTVYWTVDNMTDTALPVVLELVHTTLES